MREELRVGGEGHLGRLKGTGPELVEQATGARVPQAEVLAFRFTRDHLPVRREEEGAKNTAVPPKPQSLLPGLGVQQHGYQRRRVFHARYNLPVGEKANPGKVRSCFPVWTSQKRTCPSSPEERSTLLPSRKRTRMIWPPWRSRMLPRRAIAPSGGGSPYR